MIVAGFGFRAAATRASLEDALGRAGAGAEVFATTQDKAVTSMMVGFGKDHSVPIVGVAASALGAQSTITYSEVSINARDTSSVAEAAALAAAGPSATLLAPRVVSADRMATCALAQGEQT